MALDRWRPVWAAHLLPPGALTGISGGKPGQIFRSSVWTLAYRELKALETLTPTEATVEEA
jgi:hypothetical protein